MKLNILAIGVHPDDVELSAAGTLLAAKANGKKVGILDLSRGELGTRGSAELRDQEAAASAQILGLDFRHNLKMRDGFFRNNETNQLAIIQVIRSTRPDIILGNAIKDRHPDHGRAAELIRDACFLSGLRKVETADDHGVAQKEWRPKLFHYIQDRWIKPDFVVDISDHIDKKFEAILAFKSQFHNPASSENEPQTYISNPMFLEAIRSRAREHGRPCGFHYAEGFVAERSIGVQQLTDIF